MNLDLTSTCIGLSWTDARTAEDLIHKIILSHTDDKTTLSLKKRNRVKALPSPYMFEVTFYILSKTFEDD